MAVSFNLSTFCIALTLLCWWLLLPLLSPSVDEFQEFLSRHSFNSSRKWILATLANEAYIPLVNLFVARLSSLQIQNLIVFCIDPYIYDYCMSHHIPAWRVTDLPNFLPFWQNILQHINHRRAFSAGNIEFVSLTQLKYLVFYSVISYNFDILFSDPDILWIQNPIPYIQQEEHGRPADILIQTDRMYPHQSLFSSMNTGFLYIRSHCGTQLLLRIMMQQMYKQYPIVSQQRSFNRVLCRTGPFWYSKRVATNTCLTFLEPDHTFLSCIGVNTKGLRDFRYLSAQIVTQVFDPEMFPHGAHTLLGNMRWIDISLPKDNIVFHSDAMIIHYNWIRGVVNKTEKISQALAYSGLHFPME
ncbi:hypothetical protein GpartN1_g5132.t1 [Galdieria partita]|uniref:Nucleotide-diphospho-sugar transferase domain-containing protein n=1 Tax=Galdieria partita TaxID=83374 RepID=A0A9C7PZB1_9RHOD|nr:hypothetical protein GpartN1_g5132.t1 [Galdieria partita]